MDIPRSMELSPEELGFTVDPADIARYKHEVKNNRIIGQPRALQALRMGCRISGGGFNIFVTGKPGTGRKTAIRRILREFDETPLHLRDLAVVYNFKNPERPVVLYLKPGKAKELKSRLHRHIETLKTVIKEKLEGEPYNSLKNTILTETELAENARIDEFERRLQAEGFQMVQVEEGGAGSTDLIPVLDGSPVSFDELQERARNGDFPPDEWNRMRELYYRLMDETRQVFRELRSARTIVEEKVHALQRDILRPEVRHELDALREAYGEEDVASYLEELENDILDNLYIFTAEDTLHDESGNRSFIRYGVNILVDHTDTKAPPVIFENRPDLESLIGTLEYRFEREAEARTNFMMIRPGSLIRANGGFIVLEADHLLRDDESWQILKHTLKTSLVEIRPPKGALNLPVSAPRPEPVSIDVKVILIGGEGLYDALYTSDPDFRKLFKIAAEFDDSMKRDRDSTVEYLSYIYDFLESQGLGDITDDAAALVIAYGSKIAGDRRRLSTRFYRISDLLTEARYWASMNGKETIDRLSVEKAEEEHRYLLNLPEERSLQLISDRSIIVQLTGSAVGKINGLAVRDRGSYSFGVPMVISCSASPGDHGIVNIEREAGLSGEIHDKWMFILEGLLRSRYAPSFPLSIHASICFEQSYGGIDGDSASAAEVCALLSAVSGLPFRQDIAVTGSINQQGDIQPVGGISDKVRGFFSACEHNGLSGSQGVVIPGKNTQNLFLESRIISAVKEGLFHIYAAESIDDIIGLLSGIPGGVRNNKGQYPPDSLAYHVEKSLKTMAEQVKHYSLDR